MPAPSSRFLDRPDPAVMGRPDPAALDRLARTPFDPDAVRPATGCPWTPSQLAALNARFETLPPRRVVAWAVETFGDALALGTGFGPSGVVLAHQLTRRAPRATVFYLDTGLLFEATYALRDRLEARLGVRFTRVATDLALEAQAAREGARLWDRAPGRCCFLRKVQPLRRFLARRRAWMTGVRRDQGPTRADTPILAWEARYGVLKINPLATWTRAEVAAYLRTHRLPTNPLHAHGYPSIGCVPCTAPVTGTDAYSRAGRWAGTGKTECGLHR
jgi:phosphoadenosine phosphosulfate reductase